MKSKSPSPHWGSKIGFILATAGAAVGLGNIQRFPYITAQWGGAAFVLIYLLCVLILGLPMMLVEFSLGRNTQQNPKHAIESLRPNSLWKYCGLLGIITAFFILSYYLVISGWTLAYSLQMLQGSTLKIEDFANKVEYVIPAIICFLGLSAWIVQKGLKSGIEKLSKILMPLLLFLLIILAVRSLTLDGGGEGLAYYLYPDFSKITPKVFLFALCQAFFSLCVGEAVLVTFGSYAKKSDNLIASAIYIALFDTLIALISGLIIFPALFAFKENVDQGIGLVFNVMPKVLLKLPYGAFFGFCFFLILAFAALTTCVALLEIPCNYLMQERNWSRKKSVFIVSIAAFVISIPSALSKGISDFLSHLSIDIFKLSGFYEIMDFVWGSLAMVINALFLSIFVAWIWGEKRASKELIEGCPKFSLVASPFGFYLKYCIPLIIAGVLVTILVWN